MLNYFTLDGVDSRNYGVFISGMGVFNAPARAVKYISVPGRDGDLISMDTRLQNGTLTYRNSLIYTEFEDNIADFRAFLLQKAGYRRLVDSFNPSEYRMVSYTGPLDVKPSKQLDMGKFDLIFNAMPQRYLLSGETVQTFTANGTINNPTLFEAKPLIRAYGNGVVGIGSASITLRNNSGNYIDIDCFSGLASRGSTNMNQSITLSGYDFPTLPSGNTGISLGTGITRVQITPRWWTV
jgi:phage-related protein